MIKYVFKDDGPVTLKGVKDADPQKIGEALAVLSVRDDGRLTPSAVVEAARVAESPLHGLFEWDDGVAAEAYRLDQARQVVRVIRVVENEDDEPTRAFLSISDKAGTSYRSSAEVKNSLDLQLVVLRQAERDLEAWERRYKSIREVCDLVAVAREKATSRRKEIEARAQ